MSKQSYEPKETAKIIRKELKAAFPGVKFSVKTGRSGFDIVRVEWIDGPTRSEVDALMRKYATQGFDGMTWGIAWVVCERDSSSFNAIIIIITETQQLAKVPAQV